MQTRVLPISDPLAFPLALEILHGGGVVAFPTDTVYGLGALAFNSLAVSHISDVKGRTGEKAIPILIGDIAQLYLLASNVSETADKLARRFWPGPLTIVVPRHANVPDAISPLPTVGVRIPDYAEIIELLKRSGPMAVSSANMAGMGSSATALGVLSQLEGKIPLILDGGVTPGGIASTVVDCSGQDPVILREGPVTLAEIMKALE